jgi:amino acid adenylation domain-containing protein
VRERDKEKFMIKNIIDYFDITVARYPDKKAIIDGDKHITFLELQKKSRAIASTITQAKISKVPIAVYMQKSIEIIAVDLGIICSGNAFMNLDIGIPNDRLSKILDNVKPNLLITTREAYKNIQEIYPRAADVICVDSLLVSSNNYESCDAITKINISDSQIFCIINTSGSTGIPKSVALHQRGFLDYTFWAIETFSLSHEEILGVLSPVVFDHYVYEICLLFIHGVTLVLIPQMQAAFPIKILELLNIHNVSYIFWVPTIMVNIANMKLLDNISLPSLRLVWFAGEVMPTRQFNYWRFALPNVTFVNLYGPTEITVDCTYYKIERELSNDEPIPIGFPRKNVEVIIFNDANKECDIDDDGELCVLGSSLALGYYNNPDKTDDVFVQNYLHNAYKEIMYRTGDFVSKNNYGEIIFKGRKDTLIKHYGYRIELAEIEHIVIDNLHIIDNCCVIYNNYEKKIVLFYESKTVFTKNELRKILGDLLPKYMLPSDYIQLQEMPRNINGKIDRLSLKQMILINK